MMQNRHLKVTPLDLRQIRFRSAMRGFDRVEVTTLLAEVADDYENALRENDHLREELIRLETAIGQYRELEGGLKTTLISVQKVSDDMRETAKLEAARIIRDAESRAETTLQHAQARLADVRREIDAMKLKQREAGASIEATISVLSHTLEFVREQVQREEDANAGFAVDSTTQPDLVSDALNAKAYRELAVIAAQAESIAAINAGARAGEAEAGVAVVAGRSAGGDAA